MTTINSFRGEYRWLSNYHPSPVMAADGTEFPTVEHAYQYEKFLKPWPILVPIRKQIKEAETPDDAKEIGKKNVGLIPPEFFDERPYIMQRLLTQKFKRGSILAKKLLNTGSDELVEGNWWGDTYWGVCNDKGENWLGRILMRIREELKED